MSDGDSPSAPETDAPTPNPTPETSRASGRSVWVPPLFIGVCYLAFWQIAPRIRTESLGAVLISTLLALSILIWLNAQMARGWRRPGQLLLSLVISGLIVVPFQILLFLDKPMAPWSWLPRVHGLLDLGTVCLATSLGGLLSFILRGANMIPPVAAVLALVDIWTVLLGGPVGRIMTSTNPAAVKVTQAMTVKLPALAPRGATPFNLVVGFADFLFIAFFVAAISRFVPSQRIYHRMLSTLITVLCAYMLVVCFFGLSLPALLPLAVVMIALHWRYFQYSRSEIFAMLYAGLFILLIGAGFWYMGTHGIGPGNSIPDRR